MSWFSRLLGRKPADPIQPEVSENADGSVVASYSFELPAGGARPVRDDAVTALDAALAAHGDVQHAFDPSRLVSFADGGPPVWSVALVTVDGPRPCWLWVTYGFSGVVTPVEYREDYHQEYSLAVPCDGGEPPVWPVALLRHMCRYVLNSGAELRVGDHMPCYAPITYIPFPVEHHPMMPPTDQDALLVATDPLVPPVDTPAGPIEVRRLVGLRPEELALLQRWSSTGFIEEMRRAEPAMLTDLDRASLLADPAFRERADARAAAEGGSLGTLFVQGGWRQADQGGIEVIFPGGAQARLILDVLAARLPFDRPLALRGPRDHGPVIFEPHEDFAMAVDSGVLYFQGSLDHPQMQQILSALREDAPFTTVHLPG